MSNQHVTTIKSKKDPNAPRQPLTAYFLFAKDNRKAILDANPTAKDTEIARLNAQAWVNLSLTNQEKYQQKAVIAKEKYQEKYKIYKTQMNTGIM